MTRCDRCKGEGVYETTIHGGDGVCEADVEAMCQDCLGLGFLEAADMLTLIVYIRERDRMMAALDEPRLRLAQPIREQIAKVIATTANYSQERMAEIRAKGLVAR